MRACSTATGRVYRPYRTVLRIHSVAIENVPGVDLGRIEIARVMTAPVQVWGETALDEVGEIMMQRKTDCIVVQGGHGVAGIFTSSDAVAALTDLVRRATA